MINCDGTGTLVVEVVVIRPVVVLKRISYVQKINNEINNEILVFYLLGIDSSIAWYEWRNRYNKEKRNRHIFLLAIFLSYAFIFFLRIIFILFFLFMEVLRVEMNRRHLIDLTYF